MEGALADDRDVVEAMYPDEARFVASDSKECAVLELAGTPHDQEEHAAFQLLVQLRLHIRDYPAAEPDVVVQSSRGLSDRDLRAFLEALRANWRESIDAGEPYILPLIEACRDFLDDVQERGGECAICWESNKDRRGFSASCFHYFHTSCLSRWVWMIHETAKAKAESEDVKAIQGRAAQKINEAKSAVTALSELAAKHERAAYLASIKVNQAKEAIATASAESVPEHKLALERATVLHRNEERSAATAKHKLQNAEKGLARTEAMYADQLAVGAEAKEAPVPCPVCRSPISAASMAPFYDKEVAGLAPGKLAEDDSTDVELDAATKAYVDRVAAEVQRSMKRQKEVGGLIEEAEGTLPVVVGGGGSV